MTVLLEAVIAAAGCPVNETATGPIFAVWEGLVELLVPPAPPPQPTVETPRQRADTAIKARVEFLSVFFINYTFSGRWSVGGFRLQLGDLGISGYKEGQQHHAKGYKGFT